MQTVSVTLSDEQAERFQNIAGLLNMDVGDLLAIQASESFSGWSYEPANAVYFILGGRESWIQNREPIGLEFEAFLRGALAEISLNQLGVLVDTSVEDRPGSWQVACLAKGYTERGQLIMQSRSETQ